MVQISSVSIFWFVSYGFQGELTSIYPSWCHKWSMNSSLVRTFFDLSFVKFFTWQSASILFACSIETSGYFSNIVQNEEIFFHTASSEFSAPLSKPCIPKPAHSSWTLYSSIILCIISIFLIIYFIISFLQVPDGIFKICNFACRKPKSFWTSVRASSFFGSINFSFLYSGYSTVWMKTSKFW